MCCKHGYNEQYYAEANLMMDKLFRRIQDPFATMKSHLCSIKEHLKRFPEDQQSNAKFLALNALFCYYGDKVKEELEDNDMDCFQILQCYDDIRINNLQSTRDHLDSTEQSWCQSGSCERTAFNCRLLGSWCLQNAWTTKHNVNKFYKEKAKEYFEKCEKHLRELSEEYPSCTYLTVLYTKASTSIIFLKLKLCWFLFDRVSMKNRFDRHRPEMTDIGVAERLISSIKHVASKVERGSPWDHQIQHKLLVVQFFYHCRIAQRKEQQYNQMCAVKSAAKALTQLQTQYTDVINRRDWDMLSELLEQQEGKLNHFNHLGEHGHNTVSVVYSGDSSDSQCQNEDLSDLREVCSSATEIQSDDYF